MAQPVELDDRDPAIFEPQQPLALEPLQALVGVLPGDSRQRPDLLLGDFKVQGKLGIENRIEQLGDRARQPYGRIQRGLFFTSYDADEAKHNHERG